MLHIVNLLITHSSDLLHELTKMCTVCLAPELCPPCPVHYETLYIYQLYICNYSVNYIVVAIISDILAFIGNIGKLDISLSSDFYSDLSSDL